MAFTFFTSTVSYCAGELNWRTKPFERLCQLLKTHISKWQLEICRICVDVYAFCSKTSIWAV